MNDRIVAVVDGFKRLSTREKVLAYIDIEEIWKALPKVRLKPQKLNTPSKKNSDG
jgi:hypothetical protein